VFGHFSSMLNTSAMRTVSRFYRGHRTRAVHLGHTWHAIVHAPTGSILTSIETTTLADATGQAEWYIETRFAFRPPSSDKRTG